jgi:hypothetical protein
MDLSNIENTLHWKEKDTAKIIEAVVTNNLGYLNDPPMNLVVTDKYEQDYKLHICDLEESQVMVDWENQKRLPLFVSMRINYLKLVRG